MRRLTAVGGLWGGLLLSGFNLVVAAGYLAEYRFRSDFRLAYGSARAGLHSGWPRLYDFGLQERAVAGLGPGFSWQPFINPPPLALLVAPLTVIPFRAALATWTVLLVAALVAAWWLAAPGGRLERVAHLALATGLFPVAYGLAVGQSGTVVMLAVAAAWALDARGRQGAAGLALSAICIKPQLAFLVPVCLLATGRVRLFAAWLVASAAIAAGSLLLLGSGGIRSWLDALSVAAGWAATRRFTAAGLFGPGPAATVFGLLMAVMAILIARRHRTPEVAVAAGLMGSLLATPYLGFQDFTVLVLAGWLLLRLRPPAWQLGLGALGYLVLEAALSAGTLPVLLFRMVWLGSLALLRSGPPPPAAVVAE